MQETFHKIQAFPNPAKNTYTLSLNSSTTGTANIFIYDSMGRLIDKKEIIKSNELLQVSYDTFSYSKGIYIISVIVAGEKDNTILVIDK